MFSDTSELTWYPSLEMTISPLLAGEHAQNYKSCGISTEYCGSAGVTEMKFQSYVVLGFWRVYESYIYLAETGEPLERNIYV